MKTLKWWVIRWKIYRWIPVVFLRVKVLTWALPLGKIRPEDIRWANEQIDSR